MNKEEKNWVNPFLGEGKKIIEENNWANPFLGEGKAAAGVDGGAPPPDILQTKNDERFVVWAEKDDFFVISVEKMIFLVSVESWKRLGIRKNCFCHKQYILNGRIPNYSLHALV